MIGAMPMFNYRCEDCDERFEALVQRSTTPKCPSCQGERLKKALSSFAVGAAAATPAPKMGCGRCGDPRGPGACPFN